MVNFTNITMYAPMHNYSMLTDVDIINNFCGTFNPTTRGILIVLGVLVLLKVIINSIYRKSWNQELLSFINTLVDFFSIIASLYVAGIAMTGFYSMHELRIYAYALMIVALSIISYIIYTRNYIKGFIDRFT